MGFQRDDTCGIVPNFASSEVASYGCGHQGPSQYQLSMHGEITRLIGRGIKESRPDFCPECMINFIKAENPRRCENCGRLILQGMPVSQNRNGELSCNRFDCGCGGSLAGVWDYRTGRVTPFPELARLQR